MLPASVRIFVCTEPQDMRRSFNGLALATTQILGKDPRSGALFVFLNKRSTRAKILWWDTNGYCLLYKRLHQALFVMQSTPSGDSRRWRARAAAGQPRSGSGLSRRADTRGPSGDRVAPAAPVQRCERL